MAEPLDDKYFYVLSLYPYSSMFKIANLATWVAAELGLSFEAIRWGWRGEGVRTAGLPPSGAHLPRLGERTWSPRGLSWATLPQRPDAAHSCL